MRVTQPEGSRSRRGLAELRILRLADQHLPAHRRHPFTSGDTVKIYLRSVYHKLGVTSRTQAIER